MGESEWNRFLDGFKNAVILRTRSHHKSRYLPNYITIPSRSQFSLYANPKNTQSFYERAHDIIRAGFTKFCSNY